MLLFFHSSCAMQNSRLFRRRTSAIRDHAVLTPIINDDSQEYISLKELTQKHDYQVACDITVLHDKKSFFKTDDYIRSLSWERTWQLLPALKHPIHIVQALCRLLPSDLSAMIDNVAARSLYAIMPYISYKLLASLHCRMLQNAQNVSYSPHDNTVAYSVVTNIYVWDQDENNPPSFFSNSIHVNKKIKHHPSEKGVLVNLVRETWAMDKMGKMQILKSKDQGGASTSHTFMVKDYCFSPNNPNDVILGRTMQSNNKPLLFDVSIKQYNDIAEDVFLLPPNLDGMAYDPHHSDRLAAICGSKLHIIDTREKKELSRVPLASTNGRCAFDPHCPDIFMYSAGNSIQVFNTKALETIGNIEHASPVIDFDFDPYIPFTFISTQTNGNTMKWEPSCEVPLQKITLRRMLFCLENAALINKMNKKELVDMLSI